MAIVAIGLLGAPISSAAPTLHATEGGGASFPARAMVLSVSDGASLTTSQVRSRLRLAKPSTARRQKLPTRHSFSRTGLPSGVVSTAARKGVLPGEPRRWYSRAFFFSCSSTKKL